MVAELAKARQSDSKPQWRSIARPEQVRPDDCDVFTLVGGRGSGKTRTGAEDFLEMVRGGVKRLHILAPTMDDVRKVCVEGDSGILACARPGEIVKWNRNTLELYFASGAVAYGFSAQEPDRLNGPQCQHLWADEFGLYGAVSAIDMALFGLRLGNRVTSCWTSTPKMTRSTKYVLKYTEDMGGTKRRMRTRDNASNLAPDVVDALERKYAGTRLGQAELEGLEIEEVAGALWTREMLDGIHVKPAFVKVQGRVEFHIPPEVRQIVIALDPTVSDPELKKDPHKEMDACGIIVAGADHMGNGYVLGDFTEVLSPSQWAKMVWKLADLTRANKIVYEANQGGDLVKETLKAYCTSLIPIEGVHASMAKRPRAEPVAMLYEQGRVKHCGEFRDLEDQQCSWVAHDPSQRSPNNVDALVWAFHGLGLCSVTGMKITSIFTRNRDYDDED